MPHLGYCLRSWRRHFNVEHQVLADRIGIEPHQLGRAERDKPDAEPLAKIVVWLLDDDALPVSRQGHFQHASSRRLTADFHRRYPWPRTFE